MKVLPECYVCAMRQALSACRLASDDVDFHHRAMWAAADHLARSASRDITPPEAGEGLYRMIREMSGNPDPFEDLSRLSVPGRRVSDDARMNGIDAHRCQFHRQVFLGHTPNFGQKLIRKE